ncbi:MAG: polysaccharide biosynthesis tyrosine autokinase [Pseudomonadota bacterium]
MNELRANDYVAVEKPGGPAQSDTVAASTNLLTIVWRRKWLIAAIMTFFVVLAILWLRSATPMYSASTTIKLEVYQADIIDIESVVGGVTGDSREIRSQLQVIRSRNLMARVVDALDLTKDREFNPLLPKEPSADGEESGGFSIGGVFRWIFGSSNAERVTVPPEEIRERAIDRLIAKVSVIPVHFSFVFTVAVKTTDPRKSALIANTIAEQYKLNQIETKYEGTEQATQWLSNRVAELKVTLEEAEAAVTAHTAEHEFLTDEAIDGVTQSLVALRTTRSDIVGSRDRNGPQLAELNRLIGEGDLIGAATLSGSIRLENLAKSIMTLGGPEADGAQRALERFTTEMQAVTNRLERELAQSGANLQSVDRQIAELEEIQELQGAELVKLRQLEREAQAVSLIYETFLSRLQETTVQQGVHQADAIIISQARVPRAKSSPRLRTALGAAILLGLLVAAMVVAIVEMLDQTFSTPEEVEGYTGLPLLGIVPKAPLSARGNVLKYMLDKPSSAFVEGIRNLRTSIQLSGVDGDVKVVAMSSAGPGEGKTLLSAALAMSSATQQHCRVLLMDCDLRRRRLTLDMGGRGEDGLISYFAGKSSLDDIILTHETADFDVIYADKSPKITADIFASQKFATLMDQLRERYDMIILDTPPVLALTDIRVIATHVDLVMFSVSWKRTKRRLVRTALSLLTMNKSRRVAMVLNRTNIAKSIGYYGHYYYK